MNEKQNIGSITPIIKYHDNLNVKKIIHYKKTEQGKEIVKEEDFYENGQKKSEVSQNRYISWYENGQRKSEVSQNRHISWYEDGREMYDQSSSKEHFERMIKEK